jgi:two-component system nitrogen regulation sensor histidine kinase NtrY
MSDPRLPEIPPKAVEAGKRRRERFAIGIVAVLVVGLTMLEASLATIGKAVGYTSNIVIFALINLNVVLIVLLIFLVTRNVFKLILDRKRNILGAKIRSRLVLIFISFSLAPTILLFIAASNITTTSIRTWIGGRVGVALTSALEIAQKNLDAEARRMATVASRLAAGPLAAPPGNDESERLSAAAGEAGPDVFLLLVEKGHVAARAGGAETKLVGEILSRLKGAPVAARGGEPLFFVGNAFASAAVQLSDGRYLVAGKVVPPEDARRNREIAEAYDEYHQVRLLDDPIRASYIAVLILITLLIVFGASWMGIYLARQITVPIQLMAEATRDVASGNLDVRVDYRSNDEFGNLVELFNRMTGDLKSMKGNLESANESLSKTYEELRRRTQFIETILTNISTAVIVLDRHNHIAMINRVAERLLGISAGDVLGKPYQDAVPAAHYEPVRALSREVGKGHGQSVERQVELSVDGKKTSLRVSLTSLRSDAGEHLGFVVAFDDLSQALRLQKVLAWREVARRIAHEIRNPLTPIQLCAERMERKFGPAHAGEPAFAECTQTILAEVGTLKHLVEEFTRFARMPAPSFKEGNLGEEMRGVTETFRTAYPGIRWSFVGEGVDSVRFDAFQMRRALTNLLENAASALGGAGAVGVACTQDPGSGWVRLTVADDGPGVSPGDKDHLFEPYFSKKESGTGLGLAIVSAIANDHGGTVRVRDNSPRGLVFEMEFPAAGKE